MTFRQFMWFLHPVEINDPRIIKSMLFHMTFVRNHMAGKKIVNECVRLVPHVHHVVVTAPVAPHLSLIMRNESNSIASLVRNIWISRKRNLVGPQAVVREVINVSDDYRIETTQDHWCIHLIWLNAVAISWSKRIDLSLNNPLFKLSLAIDIADEIKRLRQISLKPAIQLLNPRLVIHRGELLGEAIASPQQCRNGDHLTSPCQ